MTANELTRKVSHVVKAAPGTTPDETKEGSEVAVTVQVRYLPHGENELVAHYLINQACREALARVDADGLARVADEVAVFA